MSGMNNNSALGKVKMDSLSDMETKNTKSKAESAKEQNLAIPVQRPA